MGYYNTFVVKIWCDNCGQMVRGRVQHVHSQEVMHFLNMGSITDFMQNHLQTPAGDAVTIDGAGNTIPARYDFREGNQDG